MGGSRARTAWFVMVGVLLVLAVAPAATWAQAQYRVIGGGNVPITQVPFQVRLDSGPYECGGSIRDASHVITAAHCVTSQTGVHVKMSPSTMTVFYGSANTSTQAAVGVSAVAVPTQYTALLNADESYDAAILTLAHPLNLSGPNARAIPIAATTQPKTTGSAFVSGWGETQDSTPLSAPPDLKGVSVLLRSDASCSSVYGADYVAARGVCAGGGTRPAGTNPDTCSGDSGGPLAAVSNGHYVLLGITSFGNACGATNPAVYTYTRGAGLSAFITTGASVDTGPTTRVNTPAAPRDVARPKARISAIKCRHRKCAFRVRTSDRGGTVKKLSAKLTRRVRKCKRVGHTKRKRCKTRTRTKRLRTHRIRHGYRMTARLHVARYKLSAVAVDSSKNRSKPATKRFRVRRR